MKLFLNWCKVIAGLTVSNLWTVEIVVVVDCKFVESCVTKFVVKDIFGTGVVSVEIATVDCRFVDGVDVVDFVVDELFGTGVVVDC